MVIMPNLLILCVTLLASFHLQLASGLKILVYSPTVMPSHVMFNGKLADVLVKAGHEVVLVLPELEPLITTNGSNFARIIRVPVGYEEGFWYKKMFHTPFGDHDLTTNPQLGAGKLYNGLELLSGACQAQIRNTELIRQLRAYKFDLGMQEQYDSCGFGLFHAADIHNYVWLSATALNPPQASALGAEYPLSYVPALFAEITGDMNFLNRMKNFVIGKATEYLNGILAVVETSLFRKQLGQSFPKLYDVQSSSRLAVIGSLGFLEYPSPTISNIIYVGGFTIPRDNGPLLPPDWLTIADSSQEGIVLMNFGTVTRASEMPPNMLQVVFDVFARFENHTFILKDPTLNDTIQTAPNVIMTNWVPNIEQLMAHRKYRATIMHGGLHGIMESVMHGVPVISVPLYADHWRNAVVVERRKVGILMNKLNFTSRTFGDALRAVLYDKIYSNNAKKYARMLADVPCGPTELLAHRITATGKASRQHGEHSTLHGRKLNIFTYRSLDTVVSIAAFFVIFICLLAKM